MARYKIVFDQPEAVTAALAMEAEGMAPLVISHKRGFMSVDIPDTESVMRDKSLAGAQLLTSEFRGRLVPDFQFDLDSAGLDVTTEVAPTARKSGLEDVIRAIKADKAWSLATGEGIIIAVVDTGIAGTRPEFPMAKRAGGWAAIGDNAWTDWEGHGSMCAAISAGTDSHGGVTRGVAPDALLMSCKTHFYDSELTTIYDTLADLAREGKVVVSTNSYGLKTGTPPPLPASTTVNDALNDAIAAGVHVYFSAGNNHEKAGGAPAACSPNSVWLHKSYESIAAVATCDLDRKMWYYSSRGPGQHYGQAGTNPKPDFTAPTPMNGEVVYGSEVRVLSNGWGTSGACPQAAGLAALLLSVDNSLPAADIRKIIAETALDLGHSHECQGHGMIDCEAAAARVIANGTS